MVPNPTSKYPKADMEKSFRILKIKISSLNSPSTVVSVVLLISFDKCFSDWKSETASVIIITKHGNNATSPSATTMNLIERFFFFNYSKDNKNL